MSHLILQQQRCFASSVPRVGVARAGSLGVARAGSFSSVDRAGVVAYDDTYTHIYKYISYTTFTYKQQVPGILRVLCCIWTAVHKVYLL